MTHYLPILPDELTALRPARSETPNTLIDKYVIDLNTPVTDKTTPFAKVYRLQKISKVDEHDTFAVVFENHIVPRTEVIRCLFARNLPCMPPLLDTRVTFMTTTNLEHYCLVTEDARGTPISKLLDQEEEISEAFIKHYILLPIIKLLKELEEQNIAHGNLNIDTLFLDEANHLMVSECVSRLPGYSQDGHYETIDRAMIRPVIGKGEPKVSDDYYALGVILVVLLSGHDLFKKLDSEVELLKRVRRGSYNYLIKFLDERDLSNEFRDLLVGLLTDKESERWNANKLILWLKGKQYNLITPTIPSDGTRGIMFNGDKYFSIKAIAYSFYVNWSQAKHFLREEYLIKWIEGSIGNQALANDLKRIKKASVVEKRHYQSFDASDELVTRTIIALDPYGPFRMQNLCFSINAIGTLLSTAYHNHQNDQINLMANIIKNGIISVNISTRPFKDENDRASTWTWAIDKCSLYIKNTHFGFGIERCIYELNPGLPCQSPIMNIHYVLSLQEMLLALEAEVINLEPHQSIYDRHVCAYIARSVKLPVEIRLRSLAMFPHLVNHNDLQKLALLVMGVNKIEIDKFPAICGHLIAPLSDILENLHSDQLREEKKQRLELLSREGRLSAILKLMTSKEYYIKDQMGFKNARKKYYALQHRKMSLKNSSHVNNSGFRYGLHISVVISYLLCAIVVLYLVATNM